MNPDMEEIHDGETIWRFDTDFLNRTGPAYGDAGAWVSRMSQPSNSAWDVAQSAPSWATKTKR